MELRLGEQHAGVLGVDLPRRVEQRPRPVGVALHQRLLRLGRELVGLARDVAVDELADGVLGQGAGELVDDLAVAEQLAGGDAADAEPLGQRLLLLGVDLRHHQLAVVALGELDEDRREHPARAAPLCPEVHQHRPLAGAFDDDPLEVGGGDVDDVG